MPVSSTPAIRAEAYRRLGVTPNDVLAMPKVTPFLRKLPGSIPTAINWIRASSSDDARRFLKLYDDPTLPKMYRDNLPIEAFCLAAAVEPARLMGIVAESAHHFGAAEGAIIAAVSHPGIVAKSAEFALEPAGTADREWNLKHMGFLPSPKGSQVNVSVNASSSVQQATFVPIPSPEDAIRKLQDKFNEGRSLPAAEPQQLTEGTVSETVPDLSGMRERTLDAMAPVVRRAEADD